MIKKPPVGAHYGLRDWLAQRATAAAMVVGTIVLAVMIFLRRPDTYYEWLAFMQHGAVRVLLFSMVLAIAWHAYIGARDIFMDYIKNDMFRMIKISGCFAYLAICVVWAAKILL